MALSDRDAEFLAERNLTFLFALRPDGSPAGWPMLSVLADGGLTFSSYAKAAKVRTCLAAGYVTALVLRRSGEQITQALCLSGRVRLKDTADTFTPAADSTAGGSGAGDSGAGTAAAADGETSGPGPAPAIAVPARVRDRARSAATEGRRAELVVDVTAGPRWRSGPAGEAGHAQA